MGGSAGKSSSSSSQETYGYDQSIAGSSQGVWGPQQDFFKSLYGQGQQLMNQQGGMQQTAQGIANPLMAQGQQAMNQALGAGGGLSAFARPDNQYLNASIAAGQADIGRGFSEQILPGLTNAAIGGGNLGGSRGQIAAGLAAQGAQREMRDLSTNMRMGGYQAAQQAAGQQGALQLAGAQAAGQMAPSLYNLGMSPYQAAWGPLQQFAGLLGDPTVLQQSFAQSVGENVGSGSSVSKEQKIGLTFM